MLGYELKDGDRVVMVEDVTTSGKSIDETYPKLKNAANVEGEGPYREPQPHGGRQGRRCDCAAGSSGEVRLPRRIHRQHGRSHRASTTANAKVTSLSTTSSKQRSTRTTNSTVSNRARFVFREVGPWATVSRPRPACGGERVVFKLPKREARRAVSRRALVRNDANGRCLLSSCRGVGACRISSGRFRPCPGSGLFF